MAKRTLSVETPFGTFSRTTDADYRFLALAEQRDNPERGVVVAGGRKGDPELATCREYTYHYEPFNPESELRTGRSWTYRSRYHAVWSKTRDGAAKNAENYPYDAVRLVGVYEVPA